MSKVRLRRLTADYHNLHEYVRSNPRVELVQAIGNPPEKYQLCYQIKSLRKETDSEPVPTMRHMVEIVLPRDYPRTPPLCRMLTSVFHPNIAPHAICIGDHWNAGEPLWSMVSRIGEMLAYQSFNVKSPLNGEAARWVEQNMDKVPLDTICMIPDTPPDSVADAVRQAVASIESKVIPATPSPPPLPAVEAISVVCPGCDATFHIKRENQGKKFQCPRCKTIFR